MTTPASLFWGMMLSAIGLGYFTYGRRQQNVPALVCGLALMVLPWFVASTVLMAATGVALMAIPWFMRR